MVNPEKTDRIVNEVGERFATFGGGRGSEFNPLAEMMKGRPLVFALGVDVRDVVEFVLERGRR
jgi:hypothetical protein